MTPVLFTLTRYWDRQQRRSLAMLDVLGEMGDGILARPDPSPSPNPSPSPSPNPNQASSRACTRATLTT